MSDMDRKEELMFEHYKDIIENRRFDEYDVLGFLIFIRRHLRKKYKYIRDFSDLVAHRERSQGQIMKCIRVELDNDYQTDDNSKKILGYTGMDTSVWFKEWRKFSKEFGINLSDDIINEITICIFSIAQHTEYDDTKYCKEDEGEVSHQGRIILFQSSVSTLCLATAENHPNSKGVAFSSTKKVNFVRWLAGGMLKKPVWTVREETLLRLKDTDGYII